MTNSKLAHWRCSCRTATRAGSRTVVPAPRLRATRSPRYADDAMDNPAKTAAFREAAWEEAVEVPSGCRLVLHRQRTPSLDGSRARRGRPAASRGSRWWQFHVCLICPSSASPGETLDGSVT